MHKYCLCYFSLFSPSHYCSLSLCLDCFCCAVLPPEVHCTQGPKGNNTCTTAERVDGLLVFKCMHLHEDKNRAVTAFPFVP